MNDDEFQEEAAVFSTLVQRWPWDSQVTDKKSQNKLDNMDFTILQLRA